MNAVVAVIAPGMMGAAVGKRLVDHGIKVLTSIEGRSAETRQRAKTAGMAAVSDDEIATSDFILSILPPGDAIALAQRFVPALTASNSKPVYVDCNAVSPPTVERIAAAIAPTGSPFVDAGIIGSPPKPNDAGPRFYASGPQAHRFARLKEFGLDVRVLDGPMTAASALKMSYAGITKGTQALGAAMLLAAEQQMPCLPNSQAASRRCSPGSSVTSRSCRPRPTAGSRKCTRSPLSSARILLRTSSISGLPIFMSALRAISRPARKRLRPSKHS